MIVERGVTIKILVADDYPVVRAGLRATLRVPRIRVVGEASGVDEALRLVGSVSPDIVVVGVPFAGTDGFDLLSQIKDTSQGVSVILLTHAVSTAYLGRALNLGCSGYLNRSVTRAELLRAIRAIARGERIVEPRLLQELLKEVAMPPAERKPEPQLELTAPQREVLRLITEGKTNRHIAQQLQYSVGTVKDHVQRIIQKLEVSDRTQAAVKGLRLGLID